MEMKPFQSAKKEVFDKITRAYPALSPKKKRVADFIIRDYKKVFFMSAREIADTCSVSEPTITRFVTDLGFAGYGEFEQYLKELLRMELTSVERLLKENRRSGETTTLQAYYQNTVMNLESMMKSVSEQDVKNVARMIRDAGSVMVAGYKASASLAHYFGYLLKKIKDGVLLDTLYAPDNLDFIALHRESLLLFVIAFPRYPRIAIELARYAKQYGAGIVCLTDSLKSPLASLSDHYVIIDIEGFSFVDPFSHIVTFLSALVHEIAHFDKTATAQRLSRIEEGVRRRKEFFFEDKDNNDHYDPLAHAVTDRMERSEDEA